MIWSGYFDSGLLRGGLVPRIKPLSSIVHSSENRRVFNPAPRFRQAFALLTGRVLLTGLSVENDDLTRVSYGGATPHMIPPSPHQFTR